jgi:hypothetical protein
VSVFYKATNAAGEKICRYHRQPIECKDVRGWFEEIAMPYSEEEYEILHELGLAWRTEDPRTKISTWAVVDELKAGKWR